MAKKEKGWLDALKKTALDFTGDTLNAAHKIGEDVLKTGGRLGEDATKTMRDFIEDGMHAKNRRK